MFHKILFENQKKRISLPLSLLICFSMFMVWQMGFIYYMGPALTINGRTPLPIMMDNITALIAAGYIFSILCLFIIPHKIIYLARFTAIIALISALGIYLPLSDNLLTTLLYVQCFCCCYLIGFETGIIVQLFSEESATKYLLAAYPIGYLLVAFLQNDWIKISFSKFRFFIILMLLMLIYFFFKLPNDHFPQFVKKSDGLVFPKRFFSGMLILFFFSMLLGVIGPSIVTEIPHGVTVYYSFAAVFSIAIYIIYKKTSSPLLQLVSILLIFAALGYVFLFASLYFSELSYLICIFASIGSIPCALIPLFGIIMAKQYPGKYISGVIISFALIAVLVHSTMLELFRSSLAHLYFAYLLLVLVFIFVYLLLEPFMLYAFRRKFSLDMDIEPDTNVSASNATLEKSSPIITSAEAETNIDTLTKDETADSPLELLTKRELDVLHLISLGHSNKEIAQILVISEHTVNDYTKKIYKKLDVHNRHAAAQYLNKLNA